MRKLILYSAVGLLLSLSGCDKKAPPSSASAYSGGNGNGNWITDFEQAKETARTEGKDMLVDFSGSDWCYWCKKLDKEVFSKADFLSEVEKNFVLVNIDYPSDTSGQSLALQEQNKELALEYRIEGYPTVILMDAEGQPYARTGYIRGGPEKYLAHLNELRK
jgi:thioredoxin-related protein